MCRWINLLFKPPIWVPVILLPLSAVPTAYSLIYLNSNSPIAILSYVFAAYTLTLWLIRTSDIISFIKRFKKENRHVRRWKEDERLRVSVSLWGLLFWNAAYSALQLWLGFYYKTFWFYSFAAYYVLLAVMRFLLLRHTLTYKPGERMKEELIKYRICGILFLIMNIALALIVFFMVYWNRTFVHHEITTIAMAAYTFTTLTVAIINSVRYRKYNSPIFSASKAISLAAASVSILTLESTMLTTFGTSESAEGFNKILLGSSGAVISAFIIATSFYMIISSTKKLKQGTQDAKQ